MTYEKYVQLLTHMSYLIPQSKTCLILSIESIFELKLLEPATLSPLFTIFRKTHVKFGRFDQKISLYLINFIYSFIFF